MKFYNFRISPFTKECSFVLNNNLNFKSISYIFSLVNQSKIQQSIVVVLLLFLCQIGMAQPAVSKQVDVPTIESGDCVSYTLTFECSKLVGRCRGVMLTDTVPEGFTFESATPAPDVITGTTLGIVGDSLIWDIGNVPAGESFQIQATFCSEPGIFNASSEVNNTILATYDENIEISDTEPVTITSEPDWTIAKAQTSGPIYHNKPVDYSLTIDSPNSPIGTQNLDDVVVMDVLPPGAVFVSATNGGTFDGTKITWILDSLIVDDPLPIVLDYVITFPASDPLNSTDAGPVDKTNMAMLTGTDQDDQPYSTSAENTSGLLPPLFMTGAGKTANDNGILVQDSTNSFSINYANESTVSLANFMVIDTMPAQFSLLRVSLGDCNNPSDSTDIDLVLTISPRGSNAVARTVTIPAIDDGSLSTFNLLMAPVNLDTLTEWVQVVKVTHGPGTVHEGFGPCEVLLTVTDALHSDAGSSTGYVDNAGNEDNICVPYENKVFITGIQLAQDLPAGTPPAEIMAMSSDDMTITPRDARLDPQKTIEIDENGQTLPTGAGTTGNPYVANLLVKYCVTLANDDNGFQNIVDPLGVDILPDGLTYEASETPPVGYLIENDNTGRYSADPSLITFMAENDTPGTGETKLSWRLMDELAPGESLDVCFYARIDEDAPAGTDLENKFCLNGNNNGLFCDENADGKPSNIIDAANCDPNEFLFPADIVQNENMCCKTVTITVADSLAVPNNTKVVSTPGPYFPFDTVCYTVVVGNDDMANSTLPDPFLLDVLSDKVTFLGDFTITSNTTGLPFDDMGTNPSFIQDVTPGGETTLRWMFDGDFPIDSEVTIDYCVQVNASESGDVINTTYVLTQDQNLDCPNGTYIDTEDYMGNGPGVVDTLCGGVEANFTLSSAAKLSSIKFVKGECDTEFSKVPDVGSTVPNGSIEYLIEIVNVGNIAFNDLRLIDILPFIGDTGVRLNMFPRESEWQPVLVSDVVQILGDPVQEIAYSTSQDPCRQSDGIVNTDNGSCDPPAWNNSPAALGGFDMINSFRIDFSNLVVEPLDTFQFSVFMEAPIDAVGIAYNSFAWAGERADNGNTLAAEPNKVCIGIKNDTVGNYVWIDIDEDGIQDPMEDPIPGLPMALFDENGNLLATTTTDANGNYYFSSALNPDQMWIGNGLPNVVSADSNYYIVAGYDPVTMMGTNFEEVIIANGESYILTLNDIGDDALDSDGTLGGADGAMTPAFLDGLIYEPHFAGANVEDPTEDFGFYPGGYDVALVKQIDSTATVLPLAYGDPVTFTIDVINQGDFILDSILVSDYIPDGFSYMAGDNTPEWDLMGSTASMYIVGGLNPGDTSTIEIVLRLQVSPTQDYVNVAEVSSIQNENALDVTDADVDSELDDDPDNNAGGNSESPADDEVDGDGTGGVDTGGASGDADNSDPAIVDIFDLALIKTVDPASLAAAGGMFDPMEAVTYFIDVTNQGNVTANNVMVTDTFPCGLLFEPGMSPGWIDNGTYATYNVGTIAPGITVQVPIVFTVKESMDVIADCGASPAVVAGMPFLNFAFIESAEDDNNDPVLEDIDSEFGTFTPNESMTDANMPGDNDTDSTGDGDLGSQDDSDPANLDVFDLALSKILTTPIPLTGFSPNDLVTFEICVTSQGNIAADSFTIADYIPDGLMFDAGDPNNGDWMLMGSVATIVCTGADIPGASLTFGEQVCKMIDLRIVGGETDYINIAEISQASGLVPASGGGFTSTPFTSDNDGDFDSIPTDDAGGNPGTASDAMTSNQSDPAILGNGSGAPGDEIAGTDEDDSDPALVPIVDFALAKMISSTQPTPYGYGDTIVFDIIVTNQGNVTGAQFEINDYVPSNMQFEPLINSGWTPMTSGPNVTVMKVLEGPLAQGESDTLNISLILLPDGENPEDYTNHSEINAAVGVPGGPFGTGFVAQLDIDSDPDTDPTDDAGADGSSADYPGSPNPADNYIDGNGTGDPDDAIDITDQDDADPAFVPVHDVALKKTTDATLVDVGDLVEFTITVYNQGNSPVDSIKITDYVPNGFDFVPNNNWVTNGANACLTATVTNGLLTAPGILPTDSAEFIIELTLNANARITDPITYTNHAEISGSGDLAGLSDDDDQDSTPDTNPTNDPGSDASSPDGGDGSIPSDNTITGDGTGSVDDGVAATDEDDADPAFITLNPYSLGNQVWNDENNNGIIDGDEMGIEGVEVTLHYYNPITMMCEIIETITTDDMGLYLFDNLVAGDYIVEITADNFAMDGPLEDFATSTGNGPSDLATGPYEDDLAAIDPDDDTDNDDNGVYDGNAMFPGAVVSDTLTLGGVDPEPTNEDPDNDPTTPNENENLTVDFGFVELYSVGNQVWEDLDNDGMIDMGESLLEGVEVVLHYYDPLTMMCIAVDTAYTNAMGLYLFDSLGAGDYIVELTAANFEMGGAFENYVSSTGSGATDLGSGPNEDASNQIDPDDDATDGDDNGTLNGNSMLPGSIVSDTLTLGGLIDEPLGEDPDNDSMTADENENLTVDFGLVPLHSLGNQVWEDTNNNGVIDVGEEVIEGVEVVLHYVDPVTGLCVALDTTYTDNMGLYLFDSLIAGDYLVEITPVNFEEDGPLEGAISSTGSGTNTNTGPNEDGMNPIDADNNADGDDNGIYNGNAMFPGSVVSDTLSLGDMEPTDEDPDNDESIAAEDNSNLTVDFGFVPMYSVGNQVWFDENDNGIIDGMEMGIEGVTIELHYYNPVTMMCEIIGTVMTDMDGLWLFDSLVAGQYIAVIPETDLAAGGVLQDFQSTTGTFNMGGAYEDTNNPIDGDSDIDGDDNGVLNLNPNFSGAVVSDTLTLGGMNPEPSGEDPDNDDYTNDENENLTLDFGFVDKVYDVALIKETMMMTGNNFGDTINFMITVTNQGNTPLTNIEITDYIATGFASVDAMNMAVTDGGGMGWMNISATDATYTILDTLMPNEEVEVNFFVTIMMSDLSNAFVNSAEVSMFQDTLGNSTDGTGPYAGGIEDEDSTPNDINGDDAGGEPGSEADNYIDGDGTGEIGDGVAATDEDDQDPALVEVIDIALTKTIPAGQTPYQYGQAVDFEIVVENQGNEPLFNIEVTDYLPAGLQYDPANDLNGWSYNDTVATTTITDTLEMWDTKTLAISLIPIQQIPSTDPTAWTNVAEVSQMFAEDENGDPRDVSDLDIDSMADDDATNDPGGAPETDSDNSTNGNGNDGGGMPGDTDAMVDEDDSDPAFLPIMDLALTKQYVDTTTIPLFGQELEFFISIHNQGNTPATNIEISEYVPASLTDTGATNDPLWDFSTNPATYVYEDTLAPGASDTIFLNMVFQPASNYEDFINYAEISEVSDTLGNNTADNPTVIADADSSPDMINGNDAGGEPNLPGNPSGTDNTIDNENEDEDDHDPLLLGFVDVALVKTLSTDGPVQVGQDVTFEIEVINQGTFDLKNFVISDYIPDGFALSANDINGWMLDIVTGIATTTIGDTIAFDESTTVEIVLTVLPNAQADNMVNEAEITTFDFGFGGDATTFDIDSDGDGIQGDDAGGAVYTDSDDAVDGNGMGVPYDDVPVTDEDDHDPAVPQVLDLALIKTIDPMTPAVRPEDIITFTIEVCNQGNIPAGSVTIEDRIPDGLKLSDTDMNGWTTIDDKTIQYTFSDELLRDSCVSVEVDMEVLPEYSAADMINVAEIVEVLDTSAMANDISAFDIDSTPNDDNGEAEESFGTDDDDSADGSVPNGEDSDDADPAAPPVFDLAIQKRNPVVGSSMRGDIIPFEIEVYNQGNLTATFVDIMEYIPEGLEFVEGQNPDWLPWAPPSEYYLQSYDPILPGESDVFILNLRILPSANPMNVVNMAEIYAASDEFDRDYGGGGSPNVDFDSDGDLINTNDVGNDIYDFENNDELNDHGIGHGLDGVDDEDDHDQAWVLLCDGMACKGSLNFSIDESCSGSLTPTMLLNGDLFPDHIYEIEVKNEDGEIVPNVFGIGDVGKTFEVSITNPLCSSNTCWLPVLVEYKFDPTIECAMNDTLSCTQLFDEASVPDVSSNCVPAELLKIDEVYIPLTCDSLFTGQMTRKWIARDIFGNTSDTCTQVISVLRTNLDSITPVQNFMLATNNAIECSSGYATDSNGHPAPSVTGVPMLEVEDGIFIDLYPFDAATICNGFVDYEDEVLQGSTNCVTKILRTWTVGEWWCSQTNERDFIQLIEIVDFEGPVVTCPADMTISTATFSCEGYIGLDLPSVSDACNGDQIRIDLSAPTSPSGFIANYDGSVIELPVGVNELTYHVYDDCDNRTDCTFRVTVRDEADPIAICDQFTTVGFGLEELTKVSAEDIDDGSFDECGPVEISVARMDSPGFDDLIGFGPDVDITCTDVGTVVMVGLLVTDAGGNTNMCMVSIEVQDKIDAQMLCPDDMEVECNFPYDPDNLGAFFGEIEIYDNCPASNKVDDRLIGELNTCGAGILTREIRLLNAQGDQIDFCTQQITFRSGTPLQYSDITPPVADVTVTGCGIESIDPSILGMPIIPEQVCQQTAIGIENDTFPFTANGACLKIIRTFKVIDWCLEDGPGSVLEPFEFTQTIKVNNTVGPEIENVFADSIFCSYEVGCGAININDYLTASSTDDCTPTNELLNSFEVKNSDGVIVNYGSGLDASGTYDVDTYTVRFISEDKCGNQEFEESTFEVRSCKLPTPYCHQGLSTTLIAMDTTGDGSADVEMVMLPASFFDAGSYHPCGYDVQVSFSSDVNDTIAVFFCSDTVGVQPIELWVTDENGGQDYCSTFVDIQDNEEVELCGELKLVDIAGRIYTELDVELPSVKVELRSLESIQSLTDENGIYAFDDMPQGGNYEVMPKKDDDHLNGVSTLDLVLIQRHILGISPLGNVYQKIAADINNDEKISAADLLSLRKVILGVNSSFPNNTSWRFIDAEYDFVSEENPWEEEIDETYKILGLSDDMQIDFIAVKTGDVNGNVDVNEALGAEIAVRSNSSLIMELQDMSVERGKLYEVKVRSAAFQELYGLQYSLDIEDLELIDILPGKMDLNKLYTAEREGQLHVSYASEDKDHIEGQDVLYTMVVKAKTDGQLSEMIELSSEGLTAESYLGKELSTAGIEIIWNNSEESTPTELLRLINNSPNPWRNNTEINFILPKDGKVELKVTDASGIVLLTRMSSLKAGEKSILLTRDDIKTKGILFYELKFNDQLVNGKMVRIE